MKKLIALCAVFAMSAALLIGCSINVGTDKNSGASSQVDSSADSSFSQNSSSENSSAAKADILSGIIKLDGKEYTVPCAYSDFVANGWTSKSADETLKARTYTLVEHLKNGSKELTVQFVNSTDSAHKYSECEIGQLEVGLDSETDIELPGGFVFDSSVTVDDVKAMYGEPSDTTKGDDYEVLRYEDDDYKRVEFFIYTDKEMIKYNSVTYKMFSLLY